MVLHVETITPTQRRAAEAHRRVVARIVERSREDSGVKCLSASERSRAFVPPPPVVPLEYPAIPALSITLWVDHEVLPLGRSLVGSKLRIEDIQLAVARHYQVKMNDLKGQRRYAQAVWARQVAMFISRELTWLSLPVIGHQFGGRDHTTVLHGARKIERLRSTDRQLAQDIDDIIMGLSEQFVIPTKPVV